MKVWIAAAVAVGAAALVVVDALAEPTSAAYAALAAASFGICAGWGALFVLMVGLSSRGSWVADLRRPLEAIVAALPVLTLAMVVVLAFADQLYPWMHGGLAGGPHLAPYEEEAVRKTAWWHDRTFLWARSAVYLLFPLGLGEALIALSRRTEREGNGHADRLRTRLSVGGLVVGFLLGSFAAFDWVMALEPGWVSTVFGAMWLTSGFLTATGAATVVVWLVRRSGGLASLPTDQIHRLGKLLFAGTIFWAYLSFAQYLIMWIGDVPSEIRFYLHRRDGAWGEIGVALIVAGFFVPFLALIPLAVKRHAGRLALVGAWVVAIHGVEHAWLVLPARPEVHTSWAVAPAFVAVVAAAIALGLARSNRVDRVPRADPLSTQHTPAHAK